MTKKIKKILGNVNKTAFFVCLGVSITLLVTSFIVPPTGVIDKSVLQGIGELFGFATLSTVLVGIERGTDLTVRHHDTEVKIDNKD